MTSPTKETGIYLVSDGYLLIISYLVLHAGNQSKVLVGLRTQVWKA